MYRAHFRVHVCVIVYARLVRQFHVMLLSILFYYLVLPLLQHSARFASLRLHRDLRFRRHSGPTFLPSSYPLDLPLNQPMDHRRTDEGYEIVDMPETYLPKWKRWSVHMMVKAWSRSQWANLGAWLKWLSLIHISEPTRPY